MKKCLAALIAGTMLLSALSPISLAVDNGSCSTFETDDDIPGSDRTAANPDLSIADDPTGSTNKVLKYTVGGGGAAYIMQKTTPIVAAPESSKIYNVGFDLYVPSSFDSSNDNGYITLNIVNGSGKYATIQLDNGTHTGISGTSYPIGEWFRVVYSFNFCEETYEAYYVKNDNTRVQLNPTNASFADMTGGGIKDIRIWAGGAGNTVYVDNYGLLSTMTPSIKTGDFDTGGSPVLSMAADPAGSTNNVLKYPVGTSDSWIRNKTTPIVAAPESSNIYNVGFDLYVPQESFNNDTNYLEVRLNDILDKANHRIYLAKSNAAVPAGVQDQVLDFPFDKWFKVVFSVDTGTQLNAHVDLENQVYNNQTKSIKNITGAINDIRIYGHGSATYYVNNYGLQSVLSPSIKTDDIDGVSSTLSIVTDPADFMNKVLKYTANADASFIRNETKPIVSEPESSKIYNVGFDLYVPSSFNSLAANGYMILQINTSTSNPCCPSYLDNGTHTGISGTSYPTDEWFRVVYSFNFSTNKYEAYYIKQDSTRTQLIEEAAIPASVTTNGIQDIRLWMGGKDNTVYVNNYGLQSTEEAGPVETPTPSPTPTPTPIPTPAPNFEIHDFEDGTWTDSFSSANMDGAVTVAAPGGAPGKALEYNTTSDLSWIKNKTSFGGYKTGKWEVGADVYVPSDALSASDSYIQFMLNGLGNQRLDLVPTGGQGAGGGTEYTTSDFPRDKWFRVRFVFDLDNNRYNSEIVQDGKVITRQFTNRPADFVTGGNGLETLRIFRKGTDTFYVDNFGIRAYTDPVVEITGFEAQTFEADAGQKITGEPITAAKLQVTVNGAVQNISVTYNDVTKSAENFPTINRGSILIGVIVKAKSAQKNEFTVAPVY